MGDKKFAAASMDPSDQTAGGFLDDVDATVMHAKYVKFDYQGKAKPVPALRLKLFVEGRTELAVEHLTAGKMDKNRPSADGLQLLSTGKGVSSKSKLGIFFAALAQHGWPKAKWALVSESIKAIEGLKVHLAQIQMKGVEDRETGETGKPYNVLTVSEIHKLPWENKGFRKAAEEALEESEDADSDEDSSDDDADDDEDTPKKGKRKAKDDDEDESDDEDSDEESEEDDDSEDKDEDSDDDSEDKDEDSDDDDEEADEVDPKVRKEAINAIVGLLGDKKHAKGVSVDDLAPLVFQAVAKSKNKRKIVELVGDEEWLGTVKLLSVKKGMVTKAK